MKTVEGFLMGALILIGLYLVITSSQSGAVIGSISTGFSSVFKTLQGRG